MAINKEDAMVADGYSYLKSVKNTKPDETSIFGDLNYADCRCPSAQLQQHAMLSTLLDYELGNNNPDRPRSNLSTLSPTTPATPASFHDLDGESESV